MLRWWRCGRRLPRGHFVCCNADKSVHCTAALHKESEPRNAFHQKYKAKLEQVQGCVCHLAELSCSVIWLCDALFILISACNYVRPLSESFNKVVDEKMQPHRVKFGGEPSASFYKPPVSVSTIATEIFLCSMPLEVPKQHLNSAQLEYLGIGQLTESGWSFYQVFSPCFLCLWSHEAITVSISLFVVCLSVCCLLYRNM